MKYIMFGLILSTPIFFTQCTTMDKSQMIQEKVIQLFVASDTHNWDKVRDVFAERVELDYSSFTGGKPTMINPDQIVKSWSGFLPKFKYTHHQLGNIQVKMNSGKTALVRCYGTATHYIPNQIKGNIWTVVGSYDFNLERINEVWKIKKMKFNFKYQDGNLELPKVAMGK